MLPRAESLAGSCQRAIEHAEAWLRCPCDEHATGGGFGLVLWDDDVAGAYQWAERSACAAWAFASIFKWYRCLRRISEP